MTEAFELEEFKENTETIQPNEKKKYATSNRQITASITWFLVTFCCGISFAFTGTLLPLITPEYINEDDGSWLVATNVFSMVIGVSLSSTFTQAVGNRMSIFICNVIWICGWICLSVAVHFYLFLVGCFFIGFSTGFGNKLAIFYLIEMPQRELRGILSVINSTFFALGQMLGHLITLILPWRRGMLLCGLVPFVSILFLKCVPELPNWLLEKGKLEEAERNFFLLRGFSQENEAEFSSSVSRSKDIVSGRKCSIFKIILRRKFMLPFFVSATLFTSQSCSGIDCLVVYIGDILPKLLPHVNTNSMIVMFDSISVICNVISCYLVKQFKRREMFLAGAIGTVLSLFLLVLNIQFQWPVLVFIVCFCTFSASVNLGVVPVVWLVPAEIFPEVSRELGIGASTIYYYLFSAVTAKFLPSLMRSYSMQVILSMVTIAFCFCSICVYFIMPETKKLTLQELESEIRKVKFGYKKNQCSRGIHVEP